MHSTSLERFARLLGGTTSRRASVQITLGAMAAGGARDRRQGGPGGWAMAARILWTNGQGQPLQEGQGVLRRLLQARQEGQDFPLQVRPREPFLHEQDRGLYADDLNRTHRIAGTVRKDVRPGGELAPGRRLRVVLNQPVNRQRRPGATTRPAALPCPPTPQHAGSGSRLMVLATGTIGPGLGPDAPGSGNRGRAATDRLGMAAARASPAHPATRGDRPHHPVSRW